MELLGFCLFFSFHQQVPFLMDGIIRSASATVVLKLGSGISGRSEATIGWSRFLGLYLNRVMA